MAHASLLTTKVGQVALLVMREAEYAQFLDLVGTMELGGKYYDPQSDTVMPKSDFLTTARNMGFIPLIRRGSNTKVLFDLYGVVPPLGLMAVARESAVKLVVEFLTQLGAPGRDDAVVDEVFDGLWPARGESHLFRVSLN